MTGPHLGWLTSTMVWMYGPRVVVWAYEYRIYPDGPESDTSADARRIPRYLAHRHHTFSNSEDLHYWRCYLNDRTLADVTLSVSVGGRCLAGLSSSCLSGGSYPVQSLASRLLGGQVFLRREGPYDPCCHGTEASAAAPLRHICILEGMTPEDLLLEYDGLPADAYLTVGDYASYFTTRLQARLSEFQEYSQVALLPSIFFRHFDQVINCICFDLSQERRRHLFWHRPRVIRKTLEIILVWKCDLGF
ncbi:hypothetical protein JCGZ_27171 [Jatropha curcas]|uniref:Aminotransferase-like plant mobile domain-containing protein n=1 Tax=Jatropha curcas TaxID=180498 RepID=A0A067JV89_JATCU|nr:hypothetical protein JCGZ_27171 [Jatropha curcas]